MTAISGDSFVSINPIGVQENMLKGCSRIDTALLCELANDAGASEEGLNYERLVVVKNGGHLESTMNEKDVNRNKKTQRSSEAAKQSQKNNSKK